MKNDKRLKIIFINHFIIYLENKQKYVWKKENRIKHIIFIWCYLNSNCFYLYEF